MDHYEVAFSNDKDHAIHFNEITGASSLIKRSITIKSIKIEKIGFKIFFI